MEAALEQPQARTGVVNNISISFTHNEGNTTNNSGNGSSVTGRVENLTLNHGPSIPVVQQKMHRPDMRDSFVVDNSLSSNGFQQRAAFFANGRWFKAHRLVTKAFGEEFVVLDAQDGLCLCVDPIPQDYSGMKDTHLMLVDRANVSKYTEVPDRCEKVVLAKIGEGKDGPLDRYVRVGAAQTIRLTELFVEDLGILEEESWRKLLPRYGGSVDKLLARHGEVLQRCKSLSRPVRTSIPVAQEEASSRNTLKLTVYYYQETSFMY